VVLLTQRVAHIRESKAGGSILESAVTTILYPNSRNTPEELSTLALSDRELAFACASALEARLALIRSGGAGAIVDMDLRALGPLVKALGGGADEWATAGCAYSTASDRLFQQHPTGCSTGIRPGWRWRSEAGSSSLIAPPVVKGIGGAEGCPREGPARPAPRPPRGWRCRARGRDRWATRGGGPGHFAASGRLSRPFSAPVLRSDGPSRAMR
jgi:hypothetical protein